MAKEKPKQNPPTSAAAASQEQVNHLAGPALKNLRDMNDHLEKEVAYVLKESASALKANYPAFLNDHMSDVLQVLRDAEKTMRAEREARQAD